MTPRSFVKLLALVGSFVIGCSRSDGPPAKPTAQPPSAEATASAGPAGERDRPAARREIAVLAGGCFWGMEELLRKQPGVLETTVGYTGGAAADPRYEDVSSGDSGHAESIQIVFDPDVTSYEAILLHFFKIHDPTTLNRQGNDIGSQYRSAIFVRNAEQRSIAERVKARVAESGEWGSPITTAIVEAGPFYPAEDHHQDYLQRNPGGYTCHYERDLSL